MRVYPAIDIMEGEVVRLFQGNPTRKNNYSDLGSPLEVAKLWESQGAEMLHIIDLDAALGRGSNLVIIRNIANEVSIPIQVGGGFRNRTKVALGFYCGIERIIIGSLAAQDPESIYQLGADYGFDRIVVSLDYKEENIATHGWQSIETQKIEHLLQQFREKGICHFLMTSIERDGSLTGPDYKLESISEYREDIIVAGGISTTNDIRNLAAARFGGAVLGKSLYESRIDLVEAINLGRNWK